MRRGEGKEGSGDMTNALFRNKSLFKNLSFHTRNSSLEGATMLKFASFCSSLSDGILSLYYPVCSPNTTHTHTIMPLTNEVGVSARVCEGLPSAILRPSSAQANG